MALIGNFGGPFFEISSINDEITADVGGGGAVILNNFFLGGYGLGTDSPEIIIDETKYDIKFRHGGLWFGYTGNVNKLAHFYSSLKLGWGNVNLELNGNDDDESFSDNFFVLTPEIGIELNVTSFFKIGLSGGYRIVNGVDNLPGGLENEKFNSPTGTITFRFGGFGDWDED
ncbi:MAG: hypothetical protein AB8G15_20395 [Saprospiraceae bacterium]